MNRDKFEKDMLAIRRLMVRHFRSESPFLDDILGVPWSDRLDDLDPHFQFDV